MRIPFLECGDLLKKKGGNQDCRGDCAEWGRDSEPWSLLQATHVEVIWGPGSNVDINGCLWYLKKFCWKAVMGRLEVGQTSIKMWRN